ncbi:MAG: sigma-70 family RNA polymerase sigma factor [Clostridiales bacterium]|nr:sigma-70 family RNA polymerase sigma factor [Clostridiales bacterium]
MQNGVNHEPGSSPAAKDISLPARNPVNEDKALIDASAQGDAAAFGELVRRYEKRVVAAAYRLCGDRQEGEDLAQDAFIKAWRAMAGYRGQASFHTWMMTILTNLWKDKLRKKQLPADSLDETVEGEEGRIQKQYRDGAPGPAAEAEANEMQEVLSGFIRELQPEYREALVLRDVQGFSYEEVAVITGSSLGTVKSRINRGRTSLKAMVLAYQEQNPGFFRLSQTRADKTGAGKAEGGEPHEG